MIDSHTHLDSCEPPNEELVAAAAEAGVDRVLTVGMDLASCRSALAAAQAFPQVYAAIGRHPTNAEGFDPGDIAELRALAAHERCVAIGETGLDLYREGAPLADQERAFEAQIALAAELGKPLIIHTRAAEEPTLRMLREHADGITVILHCFSMPDHLDEVLDRGWIVSFAGNVTYPRNDALAAAVARVPAERLLVETDAPYLTPQAVRKERNQPAYVVHTARFVAQRRGIALEELDRAVEETARRVFRW
jgi:TatD DNase family protein